ncbi:MAG: hypothetical protein UV06_C0006G0003 [Candidatus Collierbacteria bacterium GW2011_GWA2_42_17]|uniref:Uncharacterized protein n=1 Tax=Candidatus Collierbacteria bacterium GW2011_GWA2_42_17 TaxID=1618378 RepID=A0A0G1BZ70_9BACT|nr:MAG: hypothetical protein UU94_C0016G0008 [Candidatus Collierbacteria bacterium GW2011_GWB2_42_12]KKS42733.1 MAG: hypothetical protein UV06_C0006G0003 [Candidatus Collierbacteria bacterium GW2011_GWA2_42_17]KKS61428.1 MAG: hypothetical protein UV29_C0041G0003 [Candidatus Collierbacteria bacterium GW2011_GWD2_42_50]HAS69115.1 hypothetical protein [Candidatus Collierbacteria bacterium]HBX64495.1 hypothetical protein [Candidatus Collierbacteria bacterium]
MKIKNPLIIILPVIILVVAFLLIFVFNKKTTTDQTSDIEVGTKLLVNELPLADRPFTLLVPHATNRLFTFVTINANKAKAATLDLEYQSGDLLKGARATLETPIVSPYMKAIILGSCSTGGKCSFDKDLKSGTLKFKLNFEGQKVTHILKGDFAFVTGQNNLPDGKVIFAPSKATASDNLILLNSFGLPKAVDKEIVLYPIVISAVGSKNIVGTLTINQSGVTSAEIFDGQNYLPLTYTEKAGSLTITLNNKPWFMNAEITRDDEKGTKESLNLYLLGPIVLYK